MSATEEGQAGASGPRLAFERSEYDSRIARTRSAMQKAGVELLIVTDPTNMNWLTGY
ncbi:aminopeptidase P family N-terminal domain-containing protein, partial [Paraburkholderia lycopersici]